MIRQVPGVSDPLLMAGLRRRRFLVSSAVLLGSAAVAACSPRPATPTTAPQQSPTAGSASPTAVAVPPTATAPPAPTATEVPPTATPVPGPRTSNVNVLYEMTDSDGKASGGTSIFKITVAPKSDTGIRVSFSEGEVNGQGSQMMAAGWTAAVMSCLTLGLDPSKLSFTYDIGGRVDGPSAGALLTIGTLAAILGDTIPKDFAMTGTINPDLSVGPVGGIPHKIDGAAKAGIKTILVPIGQRTDIDLNTKQPVDLIRRGDDLGVTVKMVSSIFEAYKIATGKDLPQPQSAPRPDWPSDVFDNLKAQAKDWQAYYQQHHDRFATYSDAIQKNYADWMKGGEDQAAAGKKALDEGQWAVALERYVGAAEVAFRGDQLGNFVQTLADRGLDASLNAVKASSAASTMSALLETLRDTKVSTASDAVGLIDAYSNFIIGIVHTEEAASTLDSLSKNASKMKEADIEDALANAVDYFARAEIAGRIVKTNLAIWMGHGSWKAPSVQALAGIADILRHAGEANMAAFDSLIVQDIAQQYNLRDEVVKSRLQSLDEDYLIASFSMDAMNNQVGDASSKSQTTELQTAYLTLGAAMNTYALSTQLISKYYSLDAQLDKNFQITGYGREAALQSMLQLAEQHSDSSLGLSKDVPLPALYYADNAKAYREGGPSEKMDALFYFWQSSILSDVLANLTGEYGTQLRGNLPTTSGTVEFLKANSF